ncbi:hypothetical protein Ddye_019231 [Dipteronia dyeriana]|uniref:Uncharacterized protein n=1 Tax=Dipteronia dyeriana TaxID=168575 RepID=A0AAD9TXK5_9ROSI|nr:hypothetical protein Ddye_019231 [Dipteronia dyeriana]
MQSTAEVVWQGRDEPLVFLDSPKETHLFFLEGMKNDEIGHVIIQYKVYWFHSVDVNNGGISVFIVNQQGEAMLQSLNMTAHMYSDYKYCY